MQTGLVLEYRRLRERESRAADLERAEATSTALLRGVSHDLRTPLATMRTALDGLTSPGVDDADRTVLLEATSSAVEQLQALIDNLLDLSRLQTGLLHPVLRPVSLEEVLPLAVAGHPAGRRSPSSSRSPRRWCAPTRACSSGSSPTWSSNAVRVSRGTPVRVLAQVLPNEVAVLVVDRGPGVPMEQRERMFDPFQRLGDHTPGGLGLGLAVARGLTEAMRRHAHGRGHPRRRPDHGGVGAARGVRARRAAPPVARGDPMSPRVLVVDDEPALARALAINLRAHGWEVVTAADGRGALDAPPTDAVPTSWCSTSGCPTWTAPR